MVQLNTDKPWYLDNQKILEEISNEIINNFPKLSLSIEGKTVFIRGTLQILNQDKKIIDDFLVEIELPDDFPDSMPLVREMGGRIPRVTDRHINPSGEACLFVLEECQKYYPKGSSFSTFVEKCVVPYFANQSIFESTGKWLGERPHGLAGVLEYYKEEYGEKAPQVIRQLIIYMAKKRVKGHWLCHCGSAKRLRNCHMKQLLFYWSRYQKEAQTLKEKFYPNEFNS